MILTALKALPVAQKAGGILVFLVLIIAPAFCTWLYMKGQLSAQFELGKSSCETANLAALNKANSDALDKFKSTQADVSAQALTDAKEISGEAAKAKALFDSLQKGYADYAKQHPLPIGCRLDSGRARMLERSANEN